MQVKTRDQIAEKYTWKLEDIIADDNEWQSLYDTVKEGIEKIKSFNGKLTTKENIAECLDICDSVEEKAERLYVYSAMRRDQDVSEAKYQGLCDKVENLVVALSSETSFVTPQLMALDDEFLNELAKDKDLSDYDYMFECLIKDKKHTLSEKEERILAMTGMFSSTAQDAFRMLNNADIKFEPFVNSKGEEVRLSHGLYGLLLQSPDREDRRKAFECMTTAFKNNINTISALYGGNIKKNIFYTKARGYNSCFERSASGENVPVSVYERLVECVDANVYRLHDYLEYRRQKMGLEKLHMYDLHIPIVSGGEMAMEYEDACKLVIDALAPMGKEYQELLAKAFSERWVDVYENKGKRSGAYSWGTYNTHPYVLLNYQKTTHDVFTIAHEMGHCLHSYFSNNAQPHAKAGYKIFVAEVASTVNETLLLFYLLNKCNDKKEKEFLLSYMLDMFRTTVFRQTQFAQFEYEAHKMAEEGKPLTPQALSDTYYEINKKYYGGENVENDDLIRYEWSRIPHFYNAFYVYKYATGLISAVCIASNILKNGDKAVADYKKFLSAGGSMPPVEILKLAGVDLTTKAPFEQAMQLYGEFMEQLKSL